ncbi:arabinose ABC transporter permease (plasmid) [Neorhizobium sp. NCHU2750]|nr:arabinose ABC transporter permease [Neorhizobium sp. NCHU2750]
MSAGSIPSSTPQEHSVQSMYDDHEPKAESVALGMVIGKASEFFDFFTYGIASILVFPALIFSFAGDPTIGLTYSLLVFAIGYLTRPFGSALFLAIQRRFGRGSKLTAALLLLGASTAGTAFIPPYASIGSTSVTLLIVFRALQGLALGGAFDGLTSVAAASAQPSERTWYTTMPQLGAPIGFGLALLIFTYIHSSLSTEDFLAFGWRYPMYVAFAINVVALFARLRIVASSEFVEATKDFQLDPKPISRIENWRAVWTGAIVPFAGIATLVLITLYPLGRAVARDAASVGSLFVYEIIGVSVGIASIFAGAFLSKRAGALRVVRTGGAATVVFALLSLIFLQSDGIGTGAFIIIGFALLGLTYGQNPRLVARQFSRRDRYTGSAIATDLSWIIGAALTPVVASWLIDTFGSSGVCIMLAVAGAGTLMAAANIRDGRREEMVPAE